MTTTMKSEIRQRLEQLRGELAASLANEKTIDEPAASTWDACPAMWMARRSWRTGYSRRCSDRRMLRRKIRTLNAALGGKQLKSWQRDREMDTLIARILTPNNVSMKHIMVEDLIKAERALEAALVRLLTQASRYDTAGNKNAADACMREYLAIGKAADIIRQSKGRLQALAEHNKVVSR